MVGGALLVYFLLCIALVGSVTCYVFLIPLRGLSRFFPTLGPSADRSLGRGVALLLRLQPWMRSRLDIPALPSDRGVLLVSNHRSHLDVFLLLSRVPGIRVLAKSSLFKIPFLGQMMRYSRQIPVERGRLDAFIKAMDTIRYELRRGEHVHVFPEMTRCAPGFEGVQTFLTAPFHAAIQEKALILPLVVKGTDRFWPKGVFGLVWRAEPCSLEALPFVEADRFPTAEALRNEIQSQIEKALT